MPHKADFGDTIKKDPHVSLDEKATFSAPRKLTSGTRAAPGARASGAGVPSGAKAAASPFCAFIMLHKFD